MRGGGTVVDFIIENIYITLSGTGIGTLWFLPTFFFASVIFIFSKKYAKNFHSAALIILFFVSLVCAQVLTNAGYIGLLHSVSFSGLCLNILQTMLQSFIAAGFMAFGSIMWKCIYIINKKCKHPFIISAIFGLLFILVDIRFFDLYRGNDLHYAKIINFSGYILCSVSGMVGIILISNFLKNFKPFSGLLSYFGENSLVVMTTHFDYRITGLVKTVIIFLPIGLMAKKVVIYLCICLIELFICIVVNHTPLQFIYQPIAWKYKESRASVKGDNESDRASSKDRNSKQESRPKRF